MRLLLLKYLHRPFPGSVHRYYESRRRLFNDSQPRRRETAKKTKIKSRKQALRKQVHM